MTQTTIRRFILASLMAIGAMSTGTSHAGTWYNPYGVLMSDTCVSPDGAVMTFMNQAAPVGSPCSFVLYGLPGIHYGRFL